MKGESKKSVFVSTQRINKDNALSCIGAVSSGVIVDKGIARWLVKNGVISKETARRLIKMKATIDPNTMQIRCISLNESDFDHLTRLGSSTN